MSFTLPLISPTTFFLLVINAVYAFFDTFGIVHAITQGGPAGSTTILVYKVFNDGFIGLDLGGSAAQSVILMILVVTMTVIQFRFIEKKVGILMIENRPYLAIITHIVLILGVIMIALPIWITFVASTHEELRMTQAPIPLLPGTYFWDNLKQTIMGTGTTGGAPVWRMLLNSLAMAMMIAVGKISISLISAFAIVYF